jgi:hypothetical protein
MLLNSKSFLVLYVLNFLFYLPTVLSHTLADEQKTAAGKTTTAKKPAEPKTVAPNPSQSKSAVPKQTEASSVAPKTAESCTGQTIRVRKEWCAESLSYSRS